MPKSGKDQRYKKQQHKIGERRGREICVICREDWPTGLCDGPKHTELKTIYGRRSAEIVGNVSRKRKEDPSIKRAKSREYMRKRREMLRSTTDYRAKEAERMRRLRDKSKNEELE